MNTVISWLVVWIISALTIAVAAYLLPGVKVKNFGVALIAAVVLGFVNIMIRPFLLILTLPINILTLGLFTLVINAFMIMLVGAIVPDFKVNGFWNALLFSIIVALMRIGLAALFAI